MDALKVQAQIRANSEEVSNFVTDLQKWEKDMLKRDSGKSLCLLKLGSWLNDRLCFNHLTRYEKK